MKSPSPTVAAPAPPRAPRTRRLDSLTGARFVAAAMVFVFHAANVGVFAAGTVLAHVLAVSTKSAATMGVSFFFVLSGFVLTWSSRPEDTYRGFVRRRFVKVYPNHLVTFALAMVLFAAAETPPGTALLNLLLVQAWVPDPSVFLGVNGSSWSLSCELLFYALFPLLLPLVRRIRAERLWACAAAVVVLIAVLPVLAAVVLPGNPIFDPAAVGEVVGGQSIVRMWFLYAFPPVRLLDFVLGILMAHIVLRGRWVGLRPGWSGLIAVAGYVVGLVTPLTFTVDAVTAAPLALVVASLAAADEAGEPTVLARRPMRVLGDASFAFYLVHGIVLVTVASIVGPLRLPAVVGAGIVVAALAVSLVLSFALHRWVETPAVRRWGGGARSARPAPARSLLDENR